MSTEEKVRYSEAELEEFKELILQKLDQAKQDYEEYHLRFCQAENAVLELQQQIDALDTDPKPVSTILEDKDTE